MEKPNLKVVDAKRKMLEAEVELLEEVIADAIHWGRYSDLEIAFKRIRQLSKDIANQFNLGDLN